MEALKSKRGFICDMDGVIYHGSRLLEGSKAFVDWLKSEGKQFLFLTNSSARSPRELHQRLMHLGIGPACRALIAPIEMSTGRQAYFIGKPNPLIMRHAGEMLGCKRGETVIVGDRMDTDIIAGIESGIDTVLVLSGITKESDLDRYPYKPHYILKDVSEIANGERNVRAE